MLRGLFVSAVLAAASVASAQPHQQARPQAVFDANGWTLLGTQEVAGRRDRDTIMVGAQEGKFDKLTLVVTDSDVEVKDVTVVFANGDRWSPGGLRHYFREGSRTRAIDLPGNDRAIQKVELVYANTPGGGRAKVSVYAKNTKAKPAGTRPDMTGWTLLGGQAVGGRRDRDTFNVGKYEGKFDQVQLNVLDSDLELLDMTIIFNNGERWQPKIRHSFKEGQRSRAIDLPGEGRIISKIELTYANTPGGGKAYVELYGRSRKAGPPLPPNGNPGPIPPHMPTPPVFDPTGWTLLGKQTVHGARDRDVIRVGGRKGAFDRLTMVVTDSDLDLQELTLVFNNGQRWTAPGARHVFKEGTRTRIIDLPGKDRTIARIELAYANLPGGGRARVEVYGRDVGRPAPPPLTPVKWDNKGWTFIGRKTIDGWKDVEQINLSDRRASDVMFVVAGSELDLRDIVVAYEGRYDHPVSTPLSFKEGSRTGSVSIPADRRIKSIRWNLANFPRGGRSTLELWIRQPTAPATPPRPDPRPTAPPTQTAPPPPPPPPAGPTVRDHRTN